MSTYFSPSSSIFAKILMSLMLLDSSNLARSTTALNLEVINYKNSENNYGTSFLPEVVSLYSPALHSPVGLLVEPADPLGVGQDLSRSHTSGHYGLWNQESVQLQIQISSTKMVNICYSTDLLSSINHLWLIEHSIQIHSFKLKLLK